MKCCAKQLLENLERETWKKKMIAKPQYSVLSLQSFLQHISQATAFQRAAGGRRWLSCHGPPGQLGAVEQGEIESQKQKGWKEH